MAIFVPLFRHKFICITSGFWESRQNYLQLLVNITSRNRNLSRPISNLFKYVQNFGRITCERTNGWIRQYICSLRALVQEDIMGQTHGLLHLVYARLERMSKRNACEECHNKIPTDFTFVVLKYELAGDLLGHLTSVPTPKLITRWAWVMTSQESGRKWL
jgi:hypothetical protein